MTTTQEIPASQLGSLDLHQGDSLRVIKEDQGRLWVRIDRVRPASSSVGMTAAEWVDKYSGILSLKDGETIDDLRKAHMREKYGLE